ncbi:hypothetical protein SNEBB_004557 [Seison nebaliae]|nr:hypothetical protein SNEBB_004557 [Seison nebaliae]
MSSIEAQYYKLRQLWKFLNIFRFIIFIFQPKLSIFRLIDWFNWSDHNSGIVPSDTTGAFPKKPRVIVMNTFMVL